MRAWGYLYTGENALRGCSRALLFKDRFCIQSGTFFIFLGSILLKMHNVNLSYFKSENSTLLFSDAQLEFKLKCTQLEIVSNFALTSSLYCCWYVQILSSIYALLMHEGCEKFKYNFFSWLLGNYTWRISAILAPELKSKNGLRFWYSTTIFVIFWFLNFAKW